MTQEATPLEWLSRHPEVQVLRWPDDIGVRGADGMRPCLWLVGDGETPPDTASCSEDWSWVSASDAEMRARLNALASRAARHPRRPTIDAFGQLEFGDRSLFLPPIDERLATVLVERFGDVVEDDELLARAWPEGGTAQALRVHISRLRRRVEPLGLAITCVRGTGYALESALRQLTDEFSPPPRS